MFVSTTRVQLRRPATAAERAQLEEAYSGIAMAPGFRAFYLARPSETETAAVFVFDSEADFRKASDNAGPAIHTILGPLVVGAPQGERGEVNAQFINPVTRPGFLSIRVARIKDPKTPEERRPIGNVFAAKAAAVPEGRHAFYEVWTLDTELVHLGVYDSRDSRTRYMQQLGSILPELRSGLEGQIVPPVQETVGDIAMYRVK